MAIPNRGGRYGSVSARAGSSKNLTMTRAGFLKTMGMGAAAVGAAAAGLVGTARAQYAGPVTLLPTGQYPADAQELNAAINGGPGPSGTVYAGGGTIILKATDAAGVPTPFNLGHGVFNPVLPVDGGRASIRVTVSADLAGEVLPDGRKTTLAGGMSPLNSSGPVSLSITDLAFDGPQLAAGTICHSSGFKALRIVIGDVIPIVPPGAPPTNPKVAVGFQVSSINVPLFFNPGPITGDISITDCDIDLSYTRAVGDNAIESDGLFIWMRPVYADNPSSLVVSGNTITNCTLYGLHLRLYPGASVRSLVSGNYVDAGRSDYAPGVSYNYAFLAQAAPGDFLDNTFMNAGSRLGTCAILFNTSGASFLRNNVVSVEAQRGAITLGGASNNNVVSENKVTGSANWAMGVSAAGANNVFVSNNIAQLGPYPGLIAPVNIYLSPTSHDNTLVGYSGEVFDPPSPSGAPKNNVLTGYSRKVGGAVSDAVAAAADALKEAYQLEG